MIVKSRAIVLHQVKYSESSLIVTLFTETSGRQSYIVNGIRSTKSKSLNGLFQPLFLLEIEAYHKSQRDIQRIKECRIAEVYRSIPFEITKSAIAIFLAEVLYKVIHREESDPQLFEFLFHSFEYFDSMEEGSANFHLWFLVNLCRYIGFEPQNNYDLITSWFDMKKGIFVPFRPNTPLTPDMAESKLLSELFSLEIRQLHTFCSDGHQRSKLLKFLVEYYAIHFGGIGKINSLSVLTDIFH
jgi:DNA repair protein RecO (recombination protein O)